MMKKIEVKLPDHQYQELKRIQELEGFTTVSELVRAALREHVNRSNGGQVMHE